MKNKIVVLSGVSGVGKTTVIKSLIETHGFANTVSYTTREQRAEETDGQSYFFVTKAVFKKKIASDEFVEYDQKFDNYYGTSKSQLLNLLQKQNVVLALTKSGYLNLHRNFQELVCGFYLLPPDLMELKRRMLKRGSQEEEIEKRLLDIEQEVKTDAIDYDYQLNPGTVEEISELIVKTLRG